MAGTFYIVFVLDNESDVVAADNVSPPATVLNKWAEVGTYTAASADAAKQAAALEHGAGTYAATPARGWQPSAYEVQPRAVAVKTTP